MRKHKVLGHTMIMLKDLGFAISEARKAAMYDDRERLEAYNKALDYIVREVYADELYNAKTDEEKEAVVLEIPGDFYVYKPGKGKLSQMFARWEGKGNPVLTDLSSKAMIFSYESMAQEVAKELGEGWMVCNACAAANEKARRLLKAIFEEDDE